MKWPTVLPCWQYDPSTVQFSGEINPRPREAPKRPTRDRHYTAARRLKIKLAMRRAKGARA